MKRPFTFLSILMSWVTFIVWEIIVQKWLSSSDIEVLRLDLVLLLPVLTGITVYHLLKIRKEKSNY